MKNKNNSLLRQMNKEVRQSVSSAIDYVERNGYSLLDYSFIVDQLVRGEQTDFVLILDYFNVDRSKLSKDLSLCLERTKPERGRYVFDQVFLDVLEGSWLHASLGYGESSIRSGYILLFSSEDKYVRDVMRKISEQFAKINVTELSEKFAAIVEGSVENNLSQVSDRAVGTGDGQPKAGGGSQEALFRYAVDLTAEARLGRMDPIVGRDAEIREMINALMRRRQNNPILVGEAGVGKTAIVEGFAQKIVSGDVPPILQHADVMTLDIGLLQAGASMKGEFEQRLKQVVDEVQASEKLIILFIDETHTLIGAGGSQGTGDAANLLKPALARGTLRTIGATTVAEFKAHIEPDPALTRRFQMVKVDEPDTSTAIRMMRAISQPMEDHHGVFIMQDAIEASVELSHRYIPSRQLPDKSVSLLDSAAARVAVSQYAVPAAVETHQANLHALNVERTALERQEQFVGESLERASEVDELIKHTESELKTASDRWEKEKDLVEKIVSIQSSISESGNNTENSDYSSAESEATDAAGDAATTASAGNENSAAVKVDQNTIDDLNTFKTELASIQGEDPMVFAAVDKQAVGAVVEDWTGIPVGRVMSSEVETLLKLPELMEKRIIGQNHALEAIARSIQTSRAGLDKPGKPTGVFMFAGTSGVGKTETAKGLAEMMYGGEQKLITINMSEFKTPETVTALKGPPPGYVGNEKGGILTEAVKRNPYSVVLLDEIEKAHSDVNEMFFRVFDEGVMDDSNGVQVDFRNTVIILTTNAGTDIVMEACANGTRKPPIEEINELIRQPLEEAFSPAFLGRLEVIPFYPLDKDVLRKIIVLQLGRITKRLLENRKIAFSYSDDVVELIAERCNNAESGGRIIDNILNKTLLPEVSKELLVKTAAGDVVTAVAVSVADSSFKYEIS